MSVEKDIGELASKFLDSIEGDYGEKASVAIGAILVAVDHGNGEDITYHQTWAPDSAMLHEAVGLLDLAKVSRLKEF